MYDQSVFMMGDWLINDNTIWAGSDGLYFEPNDFGYEMYGYTMAIFGSNEVIRNYVNGTGEYGIYAWWWYSFGTNLYENAHVEVGDCYITYNDVWINGTGGCGIETGPYEAGYYNCDDSQAYFGDYIVSNNVVYSEYTQGIQINFQYVGEYLDTWAFPETRAIVEVGDISVNDNIVTAPNDYGLYLEYYEVGAYLYEYASVTIGRVQINRNTIKLS